MDEQGSASLNSEQLLELAQDNSLVGRRLLVDSVTSLPLMEKGALSDRERELVYDILDRVLHELEMSVRKTVAIRLAEVPDVPRELIQRLANDKIEIARPVLALSPVLLEDDLISIIREKAEEHRMAIAIRQELSHRVSSALVNAGEHKVIEALLANQKANIEPEILAQLVEESQRISEYQAPLLRREDLDPGHVERMFLWVSTALRQYIIDHSKLDAEIVDDLLEQVTKEEIQALISGRQHLRRGDSSMERFTPPGSLTPEALLQVLRAGETAMFTAMFQKMTGLRIGLIHRILFEPGAEGLAVCCKAMGIGKALFASLLALTRNPRDRTPKAVENEALYALTLYDRATEESTLSILQRWQRGAEYLAALQDLELSDI